VPPVLAAALVSVGVEAGIASTAASFIFTAVSIGLSLLFAPKVPKPEAGHIPFHQAIPPRIRIIGKRRTAGGYMLYHSTSHGTAYVIQALCDGPANQVVRRYLHEDVVELVGDTVQSLGAGRYGDGKIRIFDKLGLPTETAYSLAVSDLSPLWTDDHRGDGIASSFMRAADAGADNQAKRFPFGLPVYSEVIEATQVWDSRDGAQNWADRSTWSFAGNDNAMLQAAWILTAPVSQQGFGLDIEESIVPVLAELSAAADVCDEAVALKGGGTEKRYESHALYYSTDDPIEALNATLGACDGFIAERGDGAFTIRAGKWLDADFDVVFGDKHIISLHVRRFREDENETTGVIVKYNSHAHEHATIDAPVWPRDAYQGGDDKRIRSIEVVNCPSGIQAQRLAKRVAHYEQADISGTMVTKMYGILVVGQRGCTIRCSDDPALADARCRITRSQINLSEGTVEIDFTVIDPEACDAWDPATEEGNIQPLVTVPADEAFSTPTGLTAVPSQIAGTIIVELHFDPGDVSGPNTNYHVRWRVADIGGGVPGGWTLITFGSSTVERIDDDNVILTVNGMPAGELEFQVEAFQHDHSSYSVSATCDTTVPAPGRPTAFTAVLSGADVDLDWTSPNSANFDHARVYRALSGAGFGFATDISGAIAGSPLSPMTYLDVAPASGTYDYWVTAENAANIASLARGPETVTVP
jgi:hypothetical protein